MQRSNLDNPPHISIKKAIEIAKETKIDPTNWALQGQYMCPRIKLDGQETYYLIKVTNWQEMENITLKDLCRFSNANYYAAFFILNSLMRPSFLSRSKPAPMSQAFIGDCDYKTMKEISHPHFISNFFNTPDITQGLPKEFIRGYTTDLAMAYTKIPDALCDAIEFKDAIASAYYHKEVPTEGYWTDCNEAIYAKALKLKETSKSTDYLSETELAELRAEIMKSSGAGESKRYPIPEIKPWPNKDKFLACLKALEEMAMDSDTITTQQDLFKSTLGKPLNDLLQLNVKRISYKGYACTRLPLNEIEKDIAGDSQYEITFLDEKQTPTKIAWTQALKWYVRDYNIIPSETFMIKFQQLLKACKTHYAKKAVELRTELETVTQPKHSVPSL